MKSLSYKANSLTVLSYFPNSQKYNSKSQRDSQFEISKEYEEVNYAPGVMVFIFKNGKIALFEFTESYAIHTRESQLDRYDYSKIIEVVKNGDEFVITILTIFDKMIKVVI